MDLFEAAEYLELEIEETAEGLRLTHGPDDDKAYEEVTLEDAEEMISESNAAFERMSGAKYSAAVNRIVGKLICDNTSAWTAIADFLKSKEKEESNA